MMHKPKITTIIPTYKRPLLLKRAIKSVLNQSFQDLQVCVYDNASGDETKEIVEALAAKDQRVKYFCHKKNIGGPENFRYGLKQNQSEYFSFLSDDDLLFPEFYELAIKNLEKYPDAAFFLGNCFIADFDNKIAHRGFKVDSEGYYSINESVDTFMGKNFAPWTSMLFNYSHVKSFELSNYTINDVEYVAKIMFNFPIVVSSQVCAVFYIHNSGLSSNLKIEDMWPKMDEINKTLQKYDKVDPRVKTEVSLRIRENVIKFLFRKGKESIKIKDEKTFTQALKILYEFEAVHFIKKLKFLFKIRKIPMLWQGLYFLRKLLHMVIFKKRYMLEEKKILQLVKSVDNFRLEKE